MSNIAFHLKQIEDRINNACQLYRRSVDNISLIAVSKKQPFATLLSAYGHGIRYFGENYVQEALPKIKTFSELNLYPSWHFIGTIQSNKIPMLANSFAWIHTVQTLKQAELLHHYRKEDLPKLNICLQYNVREKPPFSGISFDELFTLASQIQTFSRLQLRGLMCLPAPASQSDQQRSSFNRCRTAFDSLKIYFPIMDTLSMGMSNDLEAAIAEGATFLRIGTAIFGQRSLR